MIIFHLFYCEIISSFGLRLMAMRPCCRKSNAFSVRFYAECQFSMNLCSWKSYLCS